MSARTKSPAKANPLKRKATVGNVTYSLQIVMQAVTAELVKRDKRIDELEEKVAIVSRDLNDMMEEVDRGRWAKFTGTPSRWRRFSVWWRENVFG